MATTESRTGFRLPWSTDRSASREASAEPVDEGAAAGAVDAGAASAPDRQPISERTAGDAAQSTEEASVTTFAPDVAQRQSPAWSPADGPGTEWKASAPDAAVEPASSTARHASDPAQPASPSEAHGRKPTKFLADLTRAMQAAAELSRTSTLEQFRADGTTVIEQIHARSATGGDELRRRADDDVAQIKEWSKAEIARIREETEHRVTSRREQLEGQLERHAALIEHEIEKVRGRIAAFETEMGRFFDSLLVEDDPASFAARAANMPEPPAFMDVDDDALAALFSEPGIGTPDRDPAPEPVAEADLAAAAASSQEPAPEPAMALEPAAEGVAPETAEAVAEPVAEAVAEAVAEDAEAAAEAVAEPVAEAVAEDPGTPVEDPAVGAAIPADEPETDAVAPAAEPSATEADVAAEAPELGGLELDPRLAMLGLTPDFGAAEAEAEAEAATSDDASAEIPEMGGDALAARLYGVGGDEKPAESHPSSTQVVVTGLVSVASIASFKRHLGRLPGVAHVGVSSGPDGEFVFAVDHEASSSLRDLIPTLPGFSSRIVAGGDGTLSVIAQDPQD